MNPIEKAVAQLAPGYEPGFTELAEIAANPDPEHMARELPRLVAEYLESLASQMEPPTKPEYITPQTAIKGLNLSKPDNLRGYTLSTKFAGIGRKGVSRFSRAVGYEEGLENTLESLYRKILGRPSDPEGYAFWDAKLNAGAKWSEVVAAFEDQAEEEARG